jgi:two-component system sensor histidine kinase UhpB
MSETSLPVPAATAGPGRSAGQRLRSLPILYKILLANFAIVVLGAVAGTSLTIELVRQSPGRPHGDLFVSFVLAGSAISLAVNFLVLRAAFRPLAALEQAALAFMRGDRAVRAGQSAYADPQLAHLADTFNAALDELDRDREKLHSLTSQVIHAQEEERKRIARELHDDTAQILFAQILRLTALKGSGDPGVEQVAGTLEAMTVEALEGVRRLALELRPPALDDLGLLAALGDLAQRFSEQTGLPVDYQSRGPRGRLPGEIELVLYRVAQEALTNVGKHAGATRVAIDLDRTAEDVSLSVRDDGGGFDPAASLVRDARGLGLGLFGMAERVELVGGSFRLWSRPGRGTEVFAFVPAPRPANGSA